MAGEIRFGELLKLVRQHGWVLDRTRGSHYIFRKPDGTAYPVPVHHGKVKPVYVRQIKKMLEGDRPAF
jgi:predicted RNA binding protein YcfA (HicA-like mRNA interferase family)